MCGKTARKRRTVWCDAACRVVWAWLVARPMHGLARHSLTPVVACRATDGRPMRGMIWRRLPRRGLAWQFIETCKRIAPQILKIGRFLRLFSEF